MVVDDDEMLTTHKQNPPPPPSSTKSGRLFGKGGFGKWTRSFYAGNSTGSCHHLGHALRRNAAGAFGPDLAKKLTQLVKMEKNVMRSLELVAKERMEVAVCSIPGLDRDMSRLLETNRVRQQQLSLWGEAGDEDVSDVTDKLGVLLYEIGDLEDQYVDRYDQYRVTMKSIRNIEASVQPSRDRKSRPAS